MVLDDGPAFDAFARARLAGLVRFGSALSGDQDTAADVVQDALVRTGLRWSRVRAVVPEGYVRRVMASIQISWWRPRRREQLTAGDRRAARRCGRGAGVAVNGIEQHRASVLRDEPPVTAGPGIIGSVLARIAGQRKRRRAVAAAVLVIAVAAVAACSGDRTARGPAGPVASRHRDPIVARIGVGPVGAVTALGVDVWAVTWHGDLVRIDTRTNAVTLREHLPGLAAHGYAALVSGGGRLWLAASSVRSVPAGQAVVLAINPATGHVIARVDLGGTCYSENPATNAPIISFGAGHLWAACWLAGNARRIVRIDPASGRADADTGVIPGSGGEWIVAGPQGIWYSTDTTQITKVDPSGTRLTRVTVSDAGYPVSFSGAQLAEGQGAIWALASADTIAQIDPATGRIIRFYGNYDPGDTFGPAAFAVGFGSAWVEGAALLRLNPRTGHVQAQVGPAGGGSTLILSRGAIWIGTPSGVVRVDPARVPG